MAPSDAADDNDFVSKTQLKQEAKELVDLGKQLVNLSPAKLAKFSLTPELAEAVELAQKINRKKDGYRRQLSFIGKLLRQTDSTAIIAEQLAQLNASSRQEAQHFQHIERLRDQLITAGDDALQEAIDNYPQLDRQRLRQLIRQANKQAKENKPPRASREIFQYLRDEIN